MKHTPTAQNSSTDTELPTCNGMVHLLWTGGWDSTYRLLSLVLVQKRTVQPYYIISRAQPSDGRAQRFVQGRLSCDLEMRAMNEIRQLVYEKSPASKCLLLPTIYKDVKDIAPDEAITQQYVRLLSKQHLGSQYDYLARFAQEAGLTSLELSIHKDDHAQKFLAPYVVKDAEGNSYKLLDNPDYEDLKLFKNFHFPILELTKLDMQAGARKHNFLDVMNKTVFCHTPTESGQPCGYCNPCRYTMEEGLSRRIPLVPRLKFYIKRILKPILKRIKH